MERSLFVGVDVHRTHNQIHCLDPTGATVTTLQLRNNRPGTQQLADLLLALLHAGDCDRIELAAEATNSSWLPFLHQLSTAPTLADWPVALSASNPRVSAPYREACDDLDTRDPEDAWLLADRLRTARTRPQPFALDAQALVLRTLTR